MSGRPGGFEESDTAIEELLEFGDIDEILVEILRAQKDANDLLRVLSGQQPTIQVQTENDTVEIEVENQLHLFDTEVELVQSSVERTLVVPREAEFVTLHVDSADGGVTSSIEFTDKNFTTVTTRDDTDSSDYTGDSNTDIYVKADVASPFVRVTISDDSALGSNSVNYNIFAR